MSLDINQRIFVFDEKLRKEQILLCGTASWNRAIEIHQIRSELFDCLKENI